MVRGGTIVDPCQGVPLRNYTKQKIWYKEGLLGVREKSKDLGKG